MWLADCMTGCGCSWVAGSGYAWSSHLTHGTTVLQTNQKQAAHVFLDVALKACKTYATTNLVPIGAATGALLLQAGGQIVFTPSKALAKVLAAELPPVGEKGGPTRVLYPASKKAQKTLEEGLAARGVGADGRPLFEVVRLNTYDTVPAEWGAEETVGALGADASVWCCCVLGWAVD